MPSAIHSAASMAFSRSAIDATRFTATGPHASHAPLPSAVTGSSFSRSARSAETPAQKVARLKEARRQQQLATLSRFDRIVDRGRVWADRAHRFTALSLIALTGVAGVVTLYALGDMIIYNRRRKKTFYETQRQLYEHKLVEARKAFASGTANDDDMLILNQDRASREIEAQRRARGGIVKRARDLLFGNAVDEVKSTDIAVVPASTETLDESACIQNQSAAAFSEPTHDRQSNVGAAHNAKRSWPAWFGNGR